MTVLAFADAVEASQASSIPLTWTLAPGLTLALHASGGAARFDRDQARDLEEADRDPGCDLEQHRRRRTGPA